MSAVIINKQKKKVNLSAYIFLIVYRQNQL